MNGDVADVTRVVATWAPLSYQLKYSRNRLPTRERRDSSEHNLYVLSTEIAARRSIGQHPRLNDTWVAVPSCNSCAARATDLTTST